MLGTIQFLVHFPLSCLGIPGNLELSLKLVSDLANLKLIPIDKILIFLFNLKPTSNKENLGYSRNLFESMGMNLLLLFAIILFVSVIGILLFIGRKNICIRNKALALK